MENYLVSVIIPCYNSEKYLDRCLESVTNQTYKKLDIILVDDGSTDNTSSLCDSWAEKDDRISVFHIKNSGVANARNLALKYAKGEFIAFVDSDDVVEPNIIEVLLNNLIQTNSDISICDYQINFDGGIETGEIEHIDKTFALQCIARGGYYYGFLWNKLYKKEVVEGVLMPKLVCSEDLVFNYYAFKNADAICNCGFKLYHYMQNGESTVHGSFGIGAFDAVKAREIILNDILNNDLTDYAVYGFVESSFVILSGLVKSHKFKGRYKEIRKEILRYKNTVFSSKLFSYKYKFKTALLWLAPWLFNLFLVMKGQ